MPAPEKLIIDTPEQIRAGVPARRRRQPLPRARLRHAAAGLARSRRDRPDRAPAASYLGAGAPRQARAPGCWRCSSCRASSSTSGYFAIFEAVWTGQTPGKRLVGIRVIDVSAGRSASSTRSSATCCASSTRCRASMPSRSARDLPDAAPAAARRSRRRHRRRVTSARSSGPTCRTVPARRALRRAPADARGNRPRLGLPAAAACARARDPARDGAAGLRARGRPPGTDPWTIGRRRARPQDCISIASGASA